MVVRLCVFKQKTAYEMRISDWSSDVCSSDLVLQATHGVVSGAPEFFRRAFGADVDAFRRILLLPQHFIFNREWFEAEGGRGQLDDYEAAIRRLSPSQKGELLAKLSSRHPSRFRDLRDEEEDDLLQIGRAHV